MSTLKPFRIRGCMQAIYCRAQAQPWMTHSTASRTCDLWQPLTCPSPYAIQSHELRAYLSWFHRQAGRRTLFSCSPNLRPIPHISVWDIAQSKATCKKVQNVLLKLELCILATTFETMGSMYIYISKHTYQMHCKSSCELVVRTVLLNIHCLHLTVPKFRSLVSYCAALQCPLQVVIKFHGISPEWLNEIILATSSYTKWIIKTPETLKNSFHITVRLGNTRIQFPKPLNWRKSLVLRRWRPQYTNKLSVMWCITTFVCNLLDTYEQIISMWYCQHDWF